MAHQLFDLVLSIKRRCIATEEKIQREYQLTHGEFHGLLILNTGEEILGNTFADRMAISASRGSRVLHRMTVKGLIETHFNPKDRRTMSIALTEPGCRVKQEVENRLKECEEKIFARLKDAQKMEIKNALRLLEQAM